MSRRVSSTLRKRMPLIKALAAIMVLIIGVAYTAPTAMSEEAGDDQYGQDVTALRASGEVASGTWGTCAWEIDAEGNLTVHEGKGSSCAYDAYGVRHSPWSNYEIVSASFDAGVELPADCSYLFDGCTSLASLDVSGWDTSQVTDMGFMFYRCSSLSSLDVSGWDTSQVTDMGFMFCGRSSLSPLDVSGWDTSRVTDMSDMFYGCTSMSAFKVGAKYNISSTYALPTSAASDGAWWSCALKQRFTVAEIQSSRNGYADTYLSEEGTDPWARDFESFSVPFCESEVQLRWSLDQLKGSSLEGGIDRDLQKTCLALSAAIENDDSGARATYILGKMGFEDMAFFESEDDMPGVILARSELSVDGERKNVYAIVVRGTVIKFTPLPWDVFTDVKGALFNGFGRAAEYTKDTFEAWALNWLRVNPADLRSSDNIFLLTGHSLGGATANRLSNLLVGNAPNSQIFCYTFEAPATLKEGESRDAANVHNLVNPNDHVVTTTSSNFSRRYGTDEWWLPDLQSSYDYTFFKRMSDYHPHGYDADGRHWDSFYEWFEASRDESAANTRRLISKLLDFYHTDWEGSGPEQWRVDYAAADDVMEEEIAPFVNRWHLVDACMAYIEWVQDGTYEDGKWWYTSNDYNAPSTERFRVCCPVDVEIYDGEGSLVARTVNGAVDESVGSGFPLASDGEEKVFLLPKCGDYDVKLVAYGDGEMSVHVDEASSDMVGAGTERRFEGVALTDGKRFLVDVGSTIVAGDDRLLVVDDNDQPLAVVAQDGTETPLSSLAGAVVGVGQASYTGQPLAPLRHRHAGRGGAVRGG